MYHSRVNGNPVRQTISLQGAPSARILLLDSRFHGSGSNPWLISHFCDFSHIFANFPLYRPFGWSKISTASWKRGCEEPGNGQVASMELMYFSFVCSVPLCRRAVWPVCSRTRDQGQPDGAGRGVGFSASVPPPSGRGILKIEKYPYLL